MILITDYLFPSKYAKWRIEGIKALIDVGADILVNKVDEYAGVSYDVDYEIMENYFNLNQYNIIIFDKKYNHLNKYNKTIDGTKFNNVIKGYSYLFTKFTDFNLNNYDNVFHIFLSGYKNFNQIFKYDQQKQFIHLYPGGGYSDKNALKSISKSCNIISTQQICTTHLKSLGFVNYIEAFGSTILPNNFIPNYKKINNKTINVCFSNMGHASHKGFKFYSLVVDRYKLMYPMDDIKFSFIGNNTESINSKLHYIDKMSQTDLDLYYNNTVDILINSEPGTAFNGWPLGVEAAVQGVVLITTDTHKSNAYFKYTKDMLYIIENDDIFKCVTYLKSLYKDRQLLNTMSLNIQRHTIAKFNFSVQQHKILEYIKNTKQINATNIYRQVCPKFECENHFFQLPNKFSFTNNNFVPTDLSVFDEIQACIQNKKKITMVRYNDGEWIASLKIPDNDLYKIHKVKWGVTGQKFVDHNILPIIKHFPDYYVGISSEVLKKQYMMKHILPFVNNTKLFDGGIFARWSIDGTLISLLDFIKSSGIDVILVGPEYLNTITNEYNFKHIICGENVWEQYEQINNSINYEITDNYTIILYCCSFVAKKIIHDNRDKNLCQLDIGAAFDGLCNKQTRPWH